MESKEMEKRGLNQKELDKVSGGKSDGQTTKKTKTCPNCHITGPHTVYLSGRIACDNCGYSYYA